MTQKHANKLASLLLAAISLQVLMPLAVFISIQAVKISQENFILRNFSETALFEKLEMTETEYKKLKRVNEKEIYFHNMMYDIHSIKKEKGKYILLLLSDKKEKELEEAAVLAANQNKKENGASFSALFTLLFHEDPARLSFSKDPGKQRFFRMNSQLIKDIYLPVPSPPPDTRA